MSALFRTVAASTKRPEAATALAGVLVVSVSRPLLYFTSLLTTR